MKMFFNVIDLKYLCFCLIFKVRKSLPLPILPGDYINVRPPPVTGQPFDASKPIRLTHFITSM